MGWADLSRIPPFHPRPVQRQTTGQLALLDLLLAGVSVENAFRNIRIFSRFRVLEPEILWRAFEAKVRRVWRFGANLIRDSCKRSA